MVWSKFIEIKYPQGIGNGFSEHFNNTQISEISGIITG